MAGGLHHCHWLQMQHRRALNQIAAADFHVGFHSGRETKKKIQIDERDVWRLQAVVDREPRWLLSAWWWVAWWSVVACGGTLQIQIQEVREKRERVHHWQRKRVNATQHRNRMSHTSHRPDGQTRPNSAAAARPPPTTQQTMTTMMFSALVRSALPPLRSASSNTPSPSSFACLHNNYARSSLSCWFNNNIRTPLFLMSGIIREKSCLQTNKSAAKRFIVRGNGRIKR